MVLKARAGLARMGETRDLQAEPWVLYADRDDKRQIAGTRLRLFQCRWRVQAGTPSDLTVLLPDDAKYCDSNTLYLPGAMLRRSSASTTCC